MELPNVVGDLPNSIIDGYLVKHLDQDGVLRLKAVEEAIKFSKTKNTTAKDLDEIITKLYKFYKSEQSNSFREVR